MGGYGVFVWGSFGMCVLVAVLEIGLLALRRRALKAMPDDALGDAREFGA